MTFKADLTQDQDLSEIHLVSKSLKSPEFNLSIEYLGRLVTTAISKVSHPIWIVMKKYFR